MASRNRFLRVFTHEGARARRFTPEQELRRSLMNCLLWEDQFYEDGVSHRRTHREAGAGGRPGEVPPRWRSRRAR